MPRHWSWISSICLRIPTDRGTDRRRCPHQVLAGRRSWPADVLQVLENSSNPGFVEISRRMGSIVSTTLSNALAWRKDGVDLPGKAAGSSERKRWANWAATVAGQGISVTPSSWSAFSAIVNGGCRSPIPKHRGSHQRGCAGKSAVKAKRQVISEETSELMRYAESVVANGGGKNAYIRLSHRRKTGTARRRSMGNISQMNTFSFSVGGTEEDLASFCM
ncbi:MAG: penicillin-binding transpeptidase domain-containing protein [Merdibacter sp.]